MRHYLDHASTSPLRPVARDAMVAALDAGWGDPSRIHEEGMAARHALEVSREQLAAFLGCRTSREVIFTSGATESIAAVSWGTAERGPAQVVTAVEHSAVRMAAAQHGDVVLVGVDGGGRVAVDDVLAALDGCEDGVACVHVQWGNHEVGTVQPVAEIVAACRERGVLVHVDAAQAAGHAAIDFASLGADLLTVSSHKLGGPAGAGALLVRRGLRLRPLLVGGDQERARRAGYEPVAAAVGFGAAAASIDVAAEAAEQQRLTDRVRQAASAWEGVHVYGDAMHHLPHLVCLGFDGVEPQGVLMGLDRAGIAVHSGSACSSETLEPSPVLEAMGVDAHRSLRASVGWSSTDSDIDAFLVALPETLAYLRRLGR
ncbi:MAG: cysteine desulfurase family protein [Acidimicrobiales bacterium]